MNVLSTLIPPQGSKSVEAQGSLMYHNLATQLFYRMTSLLKYIYPVKLQHYILPKNHVCLGFLYMYTEILRKKTIQLPTLGK